VTEVPIAIAAGTGEDNQEFGTNAVEIMEAIKLSITLRECWS
jgi:dihydroxyacetone kinase DhaKLM complex PTS-EIIA-like component DhaM